MRKIIIVLFAVACFAGIKDVSAQKFGHVNFAELYQLIPGQDTAQAAYEKHAMALQQQLEAMAKELEAKIQEFEANQGSMTQLIRSAKQRELQDLNMRFEEFRNSAQSDLSAKEAELSKPLIDKARKAVEDVAKENGYTYILNSTEGMLLYANPSDDIMNLVKKKLGI